MNEISTIDTKEAQPVMRKRGGMTPQEAAYMRGAVEPASGSVPMSTSKYLNSPLYVHAWTRMSLRKMGTDVACTYDIPDMSRALDDVADYERAAVLVAEERKKNPDFAAWLDRRKNVDFTPSEMMHYEDDTLGAVIRDFMLKSGMELKFIHDFEAQNDLEYLIKRNGQTHDIQHMASGFGPNMAGEHALAVMNIVSCYKYFSPELASFLTMANKFVTNAMLTRVSLHYDEGMLVIMEATKLGIEAGESVEKPLLTVDWENYLDWKLDDLTAHLGFKRGPGAGWDFTETTCAG